MLGELANHSSALMTSTPPWMVMWTVAVVIYAGCKFATYTSRKVTGTNLGQAIYLLAWPGMNCDGFLSSTNTHTVRPSRKEWCFAVFKLVCGLAILWVITPSLDGLGAWVQAWSGMIGIVFVLHFGSFHVLSCLWRSLGYDAVPLMNWPIMAASLSDFWSRRWNLAFRDLTHQFLFLPLKSYLGPQGALIVGFAVSGIIHDIVISAPSGGGYGLPTLYFLLQAAGLTVERQLFRRASTQIRLVANRAFCWLVVVLPCPLLLHKHFAITVIHPFLVALGAAP